jgi:hypothetical protein
VFGQRETWKDSLLPKKTKEPMDLVSKDPLVPFQDPTKRVITELRIASPLLCACPPWEVLS